ncbi:MAG: hypothetical protein K6F75_13360 [Butyrivibrio sp.]|nr:hypothetical protein [Butyrivibrio sp.]
MDTNLAPANSFTEEAPSTSQAPETTVSEVDSANSEYVEQVETADVEVAGAADEVQAVQEIQPAVDAASDYANEADTSKPALADASEIAETYGDLVEAESQVDSDKTKVDGDVENIKDKSGTAEAAVTGLQDAVSDVETIANNTKEATDNAEAAIIQAGKNIEAAGNESEANAAYEAANAAVIEANRVLEQAETDYTEKEQAYQNALTAAEQAEADYYAAIDTAGADIETAKANMHTAKEKADQLKQQIDDALKALQDAQNNIDLVTLKANADEAASNKQLADQAVADENKKNAAEKIQDLHSSNHSSYNNGNMNPLTLASNLIETYTYLEIFNGNSDAKTSSIVFSNLKDTRMLQDWHPQQQQQYRELMKMHWQLTAILQMLRQHMRVFSKHRRKLMTKLSQQEINWMNFRKQSRALLREYLSLMSSWTSMHLQQGLQSLRNHMKMLKKSMRQLLEIKRSFRE